MSNNNSANAGWRTFGIYLAVLLLVVAVLFRASFHPDKVIFSNDGPYGLLAADALDYSKMLTGAWIDLNWLGFSAGSASPNLSTFLAIALKPLYYSKFLAPISVIFLGICAWCFFHRLGLSAGPSVLGGLAMALNSNVFSNVCWGLGSRGLGAGMLFLALAAIVRDRARLFWVRIVLCGLCIGMAVMEAGDNGVIYSFFLAAFVLFQAWNEAGAPSRRLVKGVLRVVVVAVFAGFIATQGILALYTVAIKNAAGATEGSEIVRDPNEQWDWATQWSLPKTELLRIVIPGLYGYRMDTEEGGNYWGAVGRTPGWEPGSTLSPRHSGAGEYAGLLVVLVAIWAVAQACRKDASIYGPLERRWIWFWTIAFIISAALAIGRYGPFYRIVYSLPYFSAIRNPMKFMQPGHVALVILFAYGLQGMLRRYLTPVTAKGRAAAQATTGWWKALPSFERKWIIGSVAVVTVSLLGWMAYSGSRANLEKYLTTVGFDNAAFAKVIAGFSIAEVGWYVLFLLLSVGVLILFMKGTFAGPRAKAGFALLGLLLVVDLGRANRPWVKEVNYKEKYASNAILDVLRTKPYERRVTLIRGFGLPPDQQVYAQWIMNAYYQDWGQLIFPYFNIINLEITQLSRRPDDYVQFEEKTFGLNSLERRAVQGRRWTLTATRYLVGLVAYLHEVNTITGTQLQIHSRYGLAPRQGVAQPRTLEDLVLIPKQDGPIALFELTNALPRAKLFTQWQLNTNTQETLKKLADPSFDPHAAVLLSDPLPDNQQSNVSNAPPGTAEITHYKPMRIEVKANATAPSVMLVTDKFDPEWKARVDGKETKIVRANYAMRGVFVPPGEHQVTMSFEPPVKWLYVSLAGIAFGILLLLVLLFAPKRDPQPAAAA